MRSRVTDPGADFEAGHHDGGAAAAEPLGVLQALERDCLAVWRVWVDTDRCGLCEVCARNCPTGALRTERDEAELRLVFRPLLCNGCRDRRACDEVCTERALSRGLEEAPATESGPVVLNRGRLLRCAYCGKHYAPERRFRAVVRRRASGSPPDERYCPLCRSARLVVRFIDERRVGSAEYRAAHDILRRAGKRSPEE